LKRVLLGGLALLVVLGLLLAAGWLRWPRHHPPEWAGESRPDGTPTAIHKIRHVVIIMQENRSFDSYFGTYRGADGIPGLAGNPGTLPCVPDPRRHICQRPYHDAADLNAGWPHGPDQDDRREIPNYWDYANHFVLQDHMFESDISWSLPEHLYLLSGWSAKCNGPSDPASCPSAVQDPGTPPGGPGNPKGTPPDYA
jgi:hypothetical protein